MEMRQRRERLGLSRLALRRLSGVHEETIRRLEEGIVDRPRIGTAHKLERALKAAEEREEAHDAAPF